MSKTDIFDIYKHTSEFFFAAIEKQYPLSLTESVIDKFNYFPIKNAQTHEPLLYLSSPSLDSLLTCIRSYNCWFSFIYLAWNWMLNISFHFLLNNVMKCWIQIQNVSLLLLILYYYMLWMQTMFNLKVKTCKLQTFGKVQF